MIEGSFTLSAVLFRPLLYRSLCRSRRQHRRLNYARRVFFPYHSSLAIVEDLGSSMLVTGRITLVPPEVQVKDDVTNDAIV